MLETQAGPFANHVPDTHHTGRVLESLAEREPKALATMPGSTYYGDGARALRDLATVMREVLGPGAQDGIAHDLAFKKKQGAAVCGA